MITIIKENLQSRINILLKTLKDVQSRPFIRDDGTKVYRDRYKHLKEVIAAKARQTGIDLVDGDNVSDTQIIEYINGLDPTGQAAKYTHWLIVMIGTNRFRFPEDEYRIERALTIFNKVKNSPKIDINKDINKYTDFREFEQLMLKYEQSSQQNTMTIRQWDKWIKTQGYTFVYSDSKFTMLRFDNTGKTVQLFPNNTTKYESDWIPIEFAQRDIQQLAHGEQLAPHNRRPGDPATVDIAAAAISRLTAGTSYCTAHPVTAQGYLNNGPLYVIYRDGALTFLVDHTWEQFANTSDEMLSTASGQVAYFLSKVLINAIDKINHPKRVSDIIANTLRRSKDKITNAKALEIMNQAIAIGKQHGSSSRLI